MKLEEGMIVGSGKSENELHVYAFYVAPFKEREEQWNFLKKKKRANKVSYLYINEKVFFKLHTTIFIKRRRND
jgi:hypothetical protein